MTDFSKQFLNNKLVLQSRHVHQKKYSEGFIDD